MIYSKKIQQAKERLGDQLAILGHHYQSDTIVSHIDFAGDSLELARRISSLKADYVVFCGVFFMAESAAILARPGQRIHIPDSGASCAMADMAEGDDVRRILADLNDSERKVIPLTYVNSSAAVKAVVGEYGGAVCTSANARTMMRWALNEGDAVLFLPDRHLANNTADVLEIPENKRHLIDIDNPDLKSATQARLIIWPGMCPVHELFIMDNVAQVRKNDPNAKIIVHPECPPEIVRACDGAGSTSYIIKYVDEAPEGSTIYVGTETNLVNRLAERHKGSKTVLPLEVSFCEDMGKITEEKLADLLGNIENAAPVTVAEEIAVPSRLALDRMLKACS